MGHYRTDFPPISGRPSASRRASEQGGQGENARRFSGSQAHGGRLAEAQRSCGARADRLLGARVFPPVTRGDGIRRKRGGEKGELRRDVGNDAIHTRSTHESKGVTQPGALWGGGEHERQDQGGGFSEKNDFALRKAGQGECQASAYLAERSSKREEKGNVAGQKKDEKKIE